MEPSLSRQQPPPTPIKLSRQADPSFLRQLALAKAKMDFRAFLRLVFEELNPATPLSWNWHLDLICYNLCRTLPKSSPVNPTPDDRITKLIINVPPRSLKSVTVNVAFRAFLLGHHPYERVLSASYSGKLSSKFNEDVRRIMQTSWYQEMFPDARLSKTSGVKLVTTKNGHSLATSVGGTATGEGGNYLIADDLLNPEQAFSEAERAASNRFFEETFYPSRLDDKKNGVCILIMQRLNEDDVTGRILQHELENPDLPPSQKWHKVILPAECENTITHQFYNTSHTFKEGDLLHPERITKEFLIGQQKKKGSLVYAGQYQQRPAPSDGGIFNMRDFKRYTHDPRSTDAKLAYRIVQSWDTAIKETQYADYSVCLTFLQTRTGHYLLDCFMAKLGFPELKNQLSLQATRYQPNRILIEDKASGQQLIQTARTETTLPVIAITPKGDKVFRAASASPVIESGSVYLPHDAEKQPWYLEFEKQVSLFPNGKNDDAVDALSQYINDAARPMREVRVRPLW